MQDHKGCGQCNPKKAQWVRVGIASDDKNAIGELEFDINQLCEANPEFAFDDLDSDGLIDIEADVAFNKA